ncbi:hypothetical protein SLA2020_471080 [Shorea laevis]
MRSSAFILRRGSGEHKFGHYVYQKKSLVIVFSLEKNTHYPSSDPHRRYLHPHRAFMLSQPLWSGYGGQKPPFVCRWLFPFFHEAASSSTIRCPLHRSPPSQPSRCLGEWRINSRAWLALTHPSYLRRWMIF